MKPKVIAIVGPTASGKTSLSIQLAQKYNGEVISADSRQVYLGLDIGSGKVTEEEMAGVPHHLLDITDPCEVYTAADFKQNATSAIARIHSKERLPIIAGGSFFYIELLRGKMQSAPVEPNQAFRDSLTHYSDEALLDIIKEKDPARAQTIDPHNRRRLIRTLEIIEALGKVPKQTEADSPYEWLIIGIDIPKEQLHENIHRRLIERLDEGMIEEVKKLHASGLSYERLDELGLEYRYIAQYLKGDLSKDEMIETLETRIKQFAKRQMTWLKRDKEIQWFKPTNTDAIYELVDGFLNNTAS